MNNIVRKGGRKHPSYFVINLSHANVADTNLLGIETTFQIRIQFLKYRHLQIKNYSKENFLKIRTLDLVFEILG